VILSASAIVGQALRAQAVTPPPAAANDNYIYCWSKTGPSVPTPQATQAYKQQQEERAKQANKQIVETGWKHE
jgi:hypothetical protein